MVKEVNEDPDVHIDYALCDMPARRHLQGFNAPQSTYGCGYCLQAAVTKGGIHWPYNAVKAPLRTMEESKYYARYYLYVTSRRTVTNVIQCIYRENPHAPEEERKGVVADSALYDLPAFDTIWMLPIDIFHIGYEGITKTMLYRMFIASSTRESRAILMQLNFLYKRMRVFSEAARRARTIRPLQLKGSELALITFSAMITLALEVIDAKTGHWYRIAAILLQCMLL